MRASLRVLLTFGVAAGLLVGVLAGSAAAAGSLSVLHDGLPPTVAPLAKSFVAGGQARAAKSLMPVVGVPVAVGNFPTGVAANDSTAVVANSKDNTVSVLDLTANPVVVAATVAVGAFPVGVAISPDGTTAYATNFKAGTLSIIDLGTNTVTHTVNVGKDPDAVIQVGSSVYVSNLLSGTISVVDPVAGTVSGTITLTGTLQPAPSGLAASSDGHHLYVDDVRNGSTIVVDLTTNPATQVGTTSVGTYPAALAVDGTTGYVANANLAGPTPGTVSVVDLSNPSSPSTTSTVSVGSHPYGIAESPFLGEALVSNSGDGTMDVIDTGTKTVVGSPVAIGTTPDAVAITPDQTTVLVTDEGDNSVRILHINQPPAIVVPGTQTAQANDSSSVHNKLTFSSANSNALSASDSDADGNPEQVTLSVNSGILTLASTNGLTFENSTSNGSSSMTFTGTISDINTALAGMTYEPNLNAAGADTLTATIDDQGNTGDIGKPETTTNTVEIDVLNGAPTASSPIFSGAIGNTVFGVGTSPAQPSATTTGNVLTGSTDPNGDTLTAVPGTTATAHGGSVTMNSDGTFTYTPPVGYDNGSDSFGFQITDGTNTTSGSATINIANAMVWYVDSALGTNGNGESNSPFNNLASVNSASTNNGDVIFLFGGSSQKTYSGNLTLQPSQELIGQPAGLNVNSETLLPASGVNPIIKASSGTDVTIANGTVIHDVDEGQSASGVTGISGSAVTNFSMNANSDSADNGINLSGAATGTINIAGSINSAAGHSVQISLRSGGTVTFSGSVNDTGTGVSLTNNGGATIDFTGGLTVAVTGANEAYAATGGGTVDVTGSSNTLSSATGDALDVENTGIGASGLTFHSISAGTASAGPANGILLSKTGTAGGLTVTGDGNTAVGGDGSGGTIQKATTAGSAMGDVTAAKTGPISLSDMTLTGAAASGVAAEEATGLALHNDQITSNADYGALYIVGDGTTSDSTPGSYNITGNTFLHDTQTDLIVNDESSTAVNGWITSNTLGASSDRSASATNDDGIDVSSLGNGGVLNTEINNNNITGVKEGFGISGVAQDGQLTGGAASAPTLNATVTGNSINDQSTLAQDGINFSSGVFGQNGAATTVCLNVSGNTSSSQGQQNLGAPYDADGFSAYQQTTTSVFKIVGGPNENEPGASGPPGVEDPNVEAYVNSQNTGFAAGPGPQSAPSYVAQLESAGFTNATSCPTPPTPTTSPIAHGQRAHTARAHPSPAPVHASRRRADATAARSAHRITRAAMMARWQAVRRHLLQLSVHVVGRAPAHRQPSRHSRTTSHHRH